MNVSGLAWHAAPASF